ncbi:hypothetical protein HN695_04440 [Candidatus Woesearchaeota archaeon]|jgi:hypothetical protein|nr:hypothetical protein [Candidatus Woesearchaeota archaeon]MBT5272399.1 hypothetical protein [Candidatus Woesearchaeota archaeon]MBT6041266.1 hypothetical protein [Candidatus Woesearchaeota archaeon]MBT6336671.1 hypothetical protein [Candidatus Woesearchaeota archaeon]MBT7927561.1 hypothetical protein [Candidatus Woesearchaeota archaeon]
MKLRSIFILGIILLLILPAMNARTYGNYSSGFFEVDHISEKRMKGIQNALTLYCLSQAEEFDCAPYDNETPRKVGDVDGNTMINICDYKIIQAIMVPMKKFNHDYGTCCIDVNADGIIEVKDAQNILYYMMGRVDSFNNTCQ